ncbi:MAG: hypothetical protein QM804_13005 [Propionicimonas sp.]
MRSNHPTLRRLNVEWQEVAETPVPDRWRREAALASAGTLADALALVRPDPDTVLGALLRLRYAAAQRIVLQAMLGRAVLDAARDPLHDLDDYVAELWLGIATYPLARRPARIAANLALDARKRVRGRPVPLPVDPARLIALSAAQPMGADVAVLLTRARRCGVITDAAERTLRLVYAEGLDPDQAAVVLGVTPAALRQRCHRALRRLASHAIALKEVAA